MRYKGFYVDDSLTDQIFARRLSTRDNEGLTLSFKPVKEAADLADEIFEAHPDLVALDFRLDENLAETNLRHAYKGSGLAQLLRDRAAVEPQWDFPIVLVSNEQKYHKYYRPDGTAHDLFDRAYFKENVSEDSTEARRELLSLCEGYEALKAIWSSGDRLSVFGLTDKERHVVNVQELRLALEDAAAPHIAARIILRDIIDRTGILLSDGEVAARLGISPNQISLVTPMLTANDIPYNGVFGAGWRRWWAHRFDDWAEEYFKRRPTSLTAAERARIISEKEGLEVEAAKSPWNDSSDEKVAFSCACCGRPTEIRHSLTAFDPRVPRFGQRKRICWDCIQADRMGNGPAALKIDEIDANFVDEVRERATRD